MMIDGESGLPYLLEFLVARGYGVLGLFSGAAACPETIRMRGFSWYAE